jgi:hypothetical protein
VKEPRRLREESKSALERMLLHSGASYRRPPATRAKTLTALGLGSTAALSAGAASGAASFLTKLGAAKVVAAVAFGAAIAAPTGYYLWHNAHMPSGAPTIAPLVAPPAVMATGPSPAITAAAAPVPALESARAADVGHVSVASVAKVGAKASAPAESSAESLSIEIVALEAARKQLVRGDAKTALALLEEYGRACPRGRLAPEAWVLRIDALAKNGQNAAAQARAKTFLQRYPKSVLAARVRDYLKE